MHSDIPEIIYMAEGRELVIPCRVTSPNITVTLIKVRWSNATQNIFTANEHDEFLETLYLWNNFLTDIWASQWTFYSLRLL